MRSRTRLGAALAMFAAAACSKDTHGPPPPAVTLDATPIAAVSRDAAAASPPAPSSWTGTYASVAGAPYVPQDWKGVRWSVPETPAGVGDGTVSVIVDPSTGRVTGSVEGPLGPAVLDGYSADGGVTASLVRKDPSDRGFTGTLVGSVEGDKLTGSMSVSLAEVSAVRKATFALSSARPN